MLSDGCEGVFSRVLNWNLGEKIEGPVWFCRIFRDFPIVIATSACTIIGFCQIFLVCYIAVFSVSHRISSLSRRWPDFFLSFRSEVCLRRLS